jgi:hypothetical protein
MVRNDHNISKFRVNDENYERINNLNLNVMDDIEKDTLSNSVRPSLGKRFWNDLKAHLIDEKHSRSGIRDSLSYGKRFYQV